MQIKNTYRTSTLAKAFALFITLLLATTASGFALDLQTALTKGLVGEVDNGYIAIPPKASSEATGLVDVVNQQRHNVYAQIAEKNGISIEAIGQRTFQKRYPDFPAGTWVKIKGEWSQK
ncbi:MAG TPA: DUF1318 domain-containing protein [Chlorobaculum parvum]|uniref:DUF1318 domain-containing protein n=1 Tax=Chlorobaculum parvum TaxID=274539 RepID=A0A7C5DGY9_9CHLB|nr:DUF1318 domain-containing protein [Chlorobaculum parvum]